MLHRALPAQSDNIKNKDSQQRATNIKSTNIETGHTSIATVTPHYCSSLACFLFANLVSSLPPCINTLLCWRFSHFKQILSRAYIYSGYLLCINTVDILLKSLTVHFFSLHNSQRPYNLHFKGRNSHSNKHRHTKNSYTHKGMPSSEPCPQSLVHKVDRTLLMPI